MNQNNHDDPARRDTSASASAPGNDEPQAKREAEQAAQAVGEEAQELAGTAREAGKTRARQEFEQHSGRAASEVQTISRALDDAAERLDDEDSPFAGHVSTLASQLSELSTKLEEKSLDEVMRDTRRLARDNPGAFLLGSVAIGLAASRFFNASSNRDAERYPGDDADEQRYGQRHSNGSRRAARRAREEEVTS